MLQTVVQMLKKAPATEGNKAEHFTSTDSTLGTRTRAYIRQGQQQPMRATQQSWAAVASTGTQKISEWTTVTHGKKKAKKHSLGQRRILFARNVQTHTYDPRDIMFEVNKALAHARADVTVRVIKMGFVENSVCETPVDQRQKPIGSFLVTVSPSSPCWEKRMRSENTSLTRELARTLTLL